MQRCNCSQGEAKKALRRAGLDGRFEAIGTIHLSAHPNPAFRARHGVPKREALRPDAWDSDIDWSAGTVGRYFSVLLNLASMEAWLGATQHARSTETFKHAPTPKIIEQKPPNLNEIAKPVQRALRAEGFDASGRQIQLLADADEFRRRRRPAGPTLANKKRRQEP
jgi:hypothetical protein